jgi:hypothetical protein
MAKRSGFKAIAAVVTLFLLFPTLAKANSTRNVGFVSGWGRYTWHPDNSSKLVCTIIQAHNDLTFTIIFDKDNGLSFVLGNMKWKLDKGDKYNVTVSIDDYRINNNIIANVFNEHMVSLRIPDISEFIRMLHNGKILYIHTKQKTFSFPLHGSSINLDWGFDCSGLSNGRSEPNQNHNNGYNQNRSSDSNQSRSSNPFSRN